MIGEIGRSARFARNGLVVAELRGLRRAVRRFEDLSKHVGRRAGNFFAYHAFRGVIGLVDDVAVLVLDFRDHNRLTLGAAACKRCIGAGHIERSYAGYAQRCGVHRVHRRFDAQSFGHLRRCGLPDFLGKAQVSRIRRNSGGALDGAHSVIDVVEVLERLLPAVDLLGHRGGAVDARLRRDPLFYSCRKCERFERRSRLTASAARSCGDVHLANIVVATTDHGFDMARCGVDGNQGCVEISAHAGSLRITCRFRVVLQGGVQGGADGQPALEQAGIRASEGIVLLHKKVAHIAGEIRVGVNAVFRNLRSGIEIQRLGLRGVPLFLGDIASG